jgi:hypothetical protein
MAASSSRSEESSVAAEFALARTGGLTVVEFTWASLVTNAAAGAAEPGKHSQMQGRYTRRLQAERLILLATA